MKLFPSASIHGRFQILHWDHYRYFRLAADRYGALYIGLTGQRRDIQAGDARLSPERNPLTFWERVEMWRQLLCDFRHEDERHIIGPFPIERPELLSDFLPNTCVCATTVREPWNEDKIRRLQEMGYAVDVLDRNLDKALSSAMIRDMIVRDSDEWKALVPKSVADFLLSLDIRTRLMNLRASQDSA